jgi:hypothetical protein
MTERRAVMKSSRSTTDPVSTRTGSVPCSTKALMGTRPKPGMAALDARTSMPGAAWYVATMSSSLCRWPGT